MASIICATAETPDTAIRYAMMAGHVLHDDDAIELCEQYGTQKVARACLLLFARRARGQHIGTPDGFIIDALRAGYDFNPPDAPPIEKLFEEAVDDAWNEELNNVA